MNKKPVLVIGLVIIIVTSIVVFRSSAPAVPSETPTEQHEDIAHACQGAGGLWLPESRECEGLSNTACVGLHGDWNECASACRNDTAAEMCTQQCVQVCKL